MENSKTFDTIDMFVWLWKKRLPIIIVTAAAAVISIVVSLMLNDYFKATTVLFPTTFVSPATGTIRNVNQETDPMIIGNEDDLERMIQLLKSDFIMNKIIQKYNLIEHYDISKDDPHLKTKIKKAYEGNITFSKTSYQGVIVSVVDTDPEYAANIANNISTLFDTLVYDMQKQRAVEAYNLVKNAYESELAYLKELEDSLDIYRQLGILDYFNEVERYSEAYGKAVGNNTLTNKGKKFFDEKFALFKKHGKQFYTLTGLINIQRNRVVSVHHTMITTEQNIKQPLSRKYVISYAEKPDKKAFPKRSFIVIFSTMGGLIFVIAMLLFMDFFKELKTRIKKNK